ncbi:MAG: hypothetical protein LQ342_007613 [Letrouitia transgressa]|nr:MAG: hypothetical protein LQ342_007613 [Letrouitia transgressa]
MTSRPENTSSSTPPPPPPPPPPSSQQSPSTSTYLSYPVSHVVSGLYRRLTEPSRIPSASSTPKPNTAPPDPSLNTHHSSVYTPPNRTASPFQPPPLTPLTLAPPSSSSPILTRSLAEEIRLLIPPRLQLLESWSLVYSLDLHGVSLATLYAKCTSRSLPKGTSFVLVVRDALGGTFGAYLTDPPHPSPSFYGTGECFLWRATTLPASSLQLANLPPPPSAPESAGLGRSTTIASPQSQSQRPHLLASEAEPMGTSTPNTPSTPALALNGSSTSRPTSPGLGMSSGASTPERIRFKAFPYSGVNDYLIFCEQGFLSVGGGDGKYGLWLDGVLERGISSPCMTFGNEELSEEGEKFEVVGVEIWAVGS